MATTQMQRKKQFAALSENNWYGKLYKRLKQKDHDFVADFFKRYGNLDEHKYAEKVQRVFINNRELKNWTVINELLLVCAKVEVPPKNKEKKMTKPNTYIKKLGLEPAPKRTPKVLRSRIKTLKANLKAGKYKGDLAERAEFYLKEHVKALKAA